MKAIQVVSAFIASALFSNAYAMPTAHREHETTSTRPTRTKWSAQHLGYSGESVAALVFNSSDVPFVTPLYRLYNFGLTDHYVTTSWTEVQTAKSNGYSYEGITGYVYPGQDCDSVPLYRLFDPHTPDHFFTTDAGSKQVAIKQLGYVDEGIAAYVIKA